MGSEETFSSNEGLTAHKVFLLASERNDLKEQVEELGITVDLFASAVGRYIETRSRDAWAHMVALHDHWRTKDGESPQ